MAAKKKRQPAGFDVQRGFTAHVDAHRKAHGWAAICLAYCEAATTMHAKAAENEAKYWLRKMLVLDWEVGPTSSGSGSRQS